MSIKPGKQMKKCNICEKGELVKVDDIALEIEGYVFIVKGERCTNCNEEIPFEEETKRTILVAKRLGVWPEPLKLYRRLSRSGGGLVFRIPADLEKQLKLDENVEITISKAGNKIIIEAEK